MEIKKLSGQNFVSSNTKNLESINSSSVSKNIDLIKAQTRNKLSTYINIKNAVKILEKYANENGYIKLYTEVESNFVIGDIVYITYTEPTITSDIFSLENPAIPFEPYYLGYKIIKLNNYRNEIVIDRDYNDIGDGKKLSNQYISKISARGGDYFDDVSDGVVFYDCNVFEMEFGTIQGIVSGSIISGATISVLNSSYRNKSIGIMNGTISDKDGIYSINLPLGQNDLICRATGYLTTGLTLDVDSGIRTGVTIFMISGTTTIPTVDTSGITNITNITARGGGEVIDDGGEFVTKRGVCWIISGSTLPTILNEHTSNGTGKDAYSSEITFLNRGTNYIVRAYATNYVGTAYGSAVTFTTMGELPIVDTNDVSGIYSSGATGGGDVISDGGTGVTSRGVCWLSGNTTIILSPTTGDTHTHDGNGLGVFTSILTGLTRMTDYYVRAYAINSIGVIYGDEVFFRTIADLPIVETSGITNITYSGSTIGGIVVQDSIIPGYSGGDQVLERGICWNTSPNPTIQNYKVSQNLQILPNLTGYFTLTLTQLLAYTTYYARAYAINSAGVEYGGTGLTFRTLMTYPIVTTSITTNISQSGATSGGNVTYNGGNINVARGVCWSTGSTNLYLSGSSYKLSGNGVGIFTTNLTGLLSNTTYYVRAFALVSISLVSYGEIVQFLTATIPTVITNQITNIYSSGFTAGGEISNDGRLPIIEKGVCWSTNIDPTIDGQSHISLGSGMNPNPFSSVVDHQYVYVDPDWVYSSGLTPGVTYYVRAYAINGAGISYGISQSATTLAIAPVVITVDVDTITTTSAKVYGNLAYDGGGVITQLGFCYNFNSLMDPNISDSCTAVGLVYGDYSTILGPLIEATYVKVRAYAINNFNNSSIVGYGETITFLTGGGSLPLVATKVASGTTSSGTTSGVVISLTGDTNIIYKGICWGENYNIMSGSTNTIYTLGGGVGTYLFDITGLNYYTYYYVKGFARNNGGISYGGANHFRTSAIPPTVETFDPNIIICNNAEFIGSVTSDNGGSITEMGFCWSINSNPTIENSEHHEAYDLAPFKYQPHNLSASTTYYVRAYAINYAGIGYGNEKSFTTDPADTPSVELNLVSNENYHIRYYGRLNSENCSSITNYGVCASLDPDPDINDTHTNLGVPTNVPCNFTDVTPNVAPGIWYVRAYATNSLGTNYSNEMIVTVI
jgi:hypothetical protein